MRARATFERRADELTIEVREERGQARIERDGSVKRIVRGATLLVGGLDREGLADRLERFATFVEEAAAMGATELRWG